MVFLAFTATSHFKDEEEEAAAKHFSCIDKSNKVKELSYSHSFKVLNFSFLVLLLTMIDEEVMLVSHAKARQFVFWENLQ